MSARPALLAASLAGCAAAAEVPAGAEPDAAPGDVAAGDAAPGGGGAGCDGLVAPVFADLSRTLTWQGRERTYRVHVPPGYDPRVSTPVVLDFHGYGFDGAQQEQMSGMRAESDAEGFIAVHPDGTGAQKSWGAGACCGEAALGDLDDVGFVAAMLDAVAAELCVDPARVYATGMSNGGFLAHRLACELSDRIAAIAPVAGVLGVPDCAPARPVSVLQFHGTLDTLVPFAGNASFPAVAPTLAAWAARNGCDEHGVEILRQGDSRCTSWPGCDDGAEVVLCVVDGGGHTWPGGQPLPALGHTTSAISATDLAWSFFERHPMGAR